ncbi:hypothetical protein CBR_g8161 [Chara braunii]|uniref:Uncharacterized protein n=1 Tax=Chara braunii TaxID=69332 RepID=A0A388KLD6_CHABU|nr:hypothetical protein CBR_g8161 [Chara braunii]|eukprot:GBG70861.1 hypothetical protein CBR_g8161 [Chara braunii]
MSFATGQVIGARLLTPRRRISVIRQVQRPHLCSDLLRFAAFFSTSAIYAAAKFQFAEEATTRVLAEISAFRRLSPPGISHIDVVVVFTGDITAIPSVNHSDIYRTLRTWAGEVRTAWTDLLARRGDTIVPAHDTDLQLRSSRSSPAIVEEGNLTLITDELLVFLTRLGDDLPLDILSHSDKQLGTHVLSRTLEPHLVCSTCTEIDEDNCLYPSQTLYLEIDVTDLTFWDPIAKQNILHDEEIRGANEEEEEEEPSSEERDDPDYVPKREAGIADESNQPQVKDEGVESEEEEGSWLSGSDCEGFEAEVRGAARERAREQRKRKREETTEGKRPATDVSSVDPLIEDPWRDLESSEEEDDGTTVEGSRSRRRRRSESPAPSGSPSRSSLRLRQDLSVRASSPVVLSPTP